ESNIEGAKIETTEKQLNVSRETPTKKRVEGLKKETTQKKVDSSHQLMPQYNIDLFDLIHNTM
ncbi:MAG: hypothetical protein JRG99_07420, partial [Deltaproteobacteria bacterium]|nr:hypothetical protein [Deltaproteobacteria bacterium]